MLFSIKFCIFYSLSWAEQDVDPSLFSEELMANASRLVDDEEVVLVIFLSDFLLLILPFFFLFFFWTQVRYDPGFLIDKAHTATTSRGSATM